MFSTLLVVSISFVLLLVIATIYAIPVYGIWRFIVNKVFEDSPKISYWEAWGLALVFFLTEVSFLQLEKFFRFV